MDFQTNNVTLSRFGDASFMTEEQLLSNRRMLENNSRCGYTTFKLTATTKKGELVEYAFQCRPKFITYKQVRPNHASLRRAGNKSRVHDRFKRRPKLDWSILDDAVLANDVVVDNAPTVLTATHAVRTGPSCDGIPNDAALVPVSSNGGHNLTLVPTEGRIKRARLEVGDGGELVYTDYDGKTLILLHRTAQEAYEDGEEAFETFCERVACDPMWRDFTKDEVREHLSNEMCYSIDEGFISYEYGIEIGHVQGYLHIGQKSIGLLDAIDCSMQTVSEWMELFEIECSASVRAGSPYHIHCDGLLGGNRKAKQSKKPKSTHGASSNGRNVNAHRARKPKPRSKEPSKLTIAAEISGSKTNKPHLSRGFQVNASVAAVTNFVLDEQRYKTDLPITISCGPKGSMLLDLRDTFKSFATRASTLKQQEPTTCLTKYAKVTPKSVTLHFEMLNEVTGSIGVMSFSSDEYMPTDDVPSFIAARAMVKNSDCFVIELKGKQKFAVTLPVVGGIHGFDEQFVNIVAFAYTDLLVKQTGWAGTSASLSGEPADIVAGSRYSLAMVTCKYNYAGVYYAPRNVDDSQLRREIAIPYTTTTMGVAHTPANAEFASTTFSGTLVAGLAPPSPPQTAAQLVVMSDAAGDHTADLFITLLEKYNPEVEPVIEHALRVVCNVGGMMLPGWMTTVIDTTARVVNYIISDNAKDRIAANGLPDTYAVQSMPEYVSCSGVSSTSPTSNPYSCARTSIYQNIMDQLPTHGNLTAGYKLWQTLVQLQQDKGFYPEVTARNTGQTEPGMLAFSGFIPQRADGTVFNLLQDELYMPSGIPDSIGPVPSAALPHDVQYGLRVESTNDEAQLVILSALNDGSVDDPRDYWRAHNLPFNVTSMLDVGHLFGETTMNGSCHVTFSFEHIGEGSGPLHDPRVNTTGCFPWGVASALVQVQNPYIKFVAISDNHRVHYNSVSTGDRIRSPCFKAGDNPSLYRIRFNRYNLKLWDEAEHGPLDAPVGAMPLTDLTICGDVEKNPGPIPLAVAIAIWIAENVGFAAFWDLVTKKSDEAAVSFHEARQTALVYRYGSEVPPTDHMSPHALAHTLYRPGSSCEGVCSLKAQICVDIMGASSERHLRFLQCLLIVLSGDVEENPGPLNERERKRPNVEITPEVSEDIAACLRLKLMEVVEAPPHEVLEEREQQRADSYDNLFFFGVHPRQFVPTTPPEYRPSRDRLRPNTLDAPMGWVRWADTLYDCPLYFDCPRRCSHCRLVPYGEIFTLDELVDDHCERSFVSRGQLNGTHGEYTCSDDMSRKRKTHKNSSTADSAQNLRNAVNLGAASSSGPPSSSKSAAPAPSGKPSKNRRKRGGKKTPRDSVGGAKSETVAAPIDPATALMAAMAQNMLANDQRAKDEQARKSQQKPPPAKKNDEPKVNRRLVELRDRVETRKLSNDLLSTRDYPLDPYGGFSVGQTTEQFSARYGNPAEAPFLMPVSGMDVQTHTLDEWIRIFNNSNSYHVKDKILEALDRHPLVSLEDDLDADLLPFFRRQAASLCPDTDFWRRMSARIWDPDYEQEGPWDRFLLKRHVDFKVKHLTMTVPISIELPNGADSAAACVHDTRTLSSRPIFATKLASWLFRGCVAGVVAKYKLPHCIPFAAYLDFLLTRTSVVEINGDPPERIHDLPVLAHGQVDEPHADLPLRCRNQLHPASVMRGTLRSLIVVSKQEGLPRYENVLYSPEFMANFWKSSYYSRDPVLVHAALCTALDQCSNISWTPEARQCVVSLRLVEVATDPNSGFLRPPVGGTNLGTTSSSPTRGGLEKAFEFAVRVAEGSSVTGMILRHAPWLSVCFAMLGVSYVTPTPLTLFSQLRERCSVCVAKLPSLTQLSSKTSRTLWHALSILKVSLVERGFISRWRNGVLALLTPKLNSLFSLPSSMSLGPRLLILTLAAGLTATFQP